MRCVCVFIFCFCAPRSVAANARLIFAPYYYGIVPNMVQDSFIPNIQLCLDAL